MRFLLYPVRKAAVTHATTPAKAVATGAQTSSSSLAVTAWGQQCSPHCGCVVRFEENNSSQLSYTAKRVVVMPSSKTVVTTGKGRPMLTTCTCTHVQYLAQSLTQHYNNNNNSNSTSCWRTRAVNDAQFRANRSSVAFARTALRTQGLNHDDNNMHCWDVVEEAWTALIQGRLPAARRTLPQQEESPTRRPAEIEPQEETPAYHPHYYFRSLEPWSVSSTLSMFDRQEEKRQATATAMPENNKDMGAEWQAYVDRLAEEEQQQQQAGQA